MGLLDCLDPRPPAGARPGTVLHVRIELKGELRDPKATYHLVQAEPPVVNALEVVSRDGDVDLTKILIQDQRPHLTEITFELTGQLTFAGRAYDIAFRRPAWIAFNVRRKDGGRTPPGLFRAFFPDRTKPKVLTVLDENNDGREYLYCLRIRALGALALWGKLDPSIINR